VITGSLLSVTPSGCRRAAQAVRLASKRLMTVLVQTEPRPPQPPTQTPPAPVQEPPDKPESEPGSPVHEPDPHEPKRWAA